MKKCLGVPLREFAKGKKQAELVELLGISQGAISQMLNSTRDIRIRTLPDGKVEALEIRPIGRKSGKNAA